jgi:gamma-glutamyltranspeptidase/glutathione hydrolase
VLAGLLQRIGRHGARAFYEGHCARATERAAQAAGGSLAAADLAEHTTVIRAPLEGSYRGFDIAVQPPVSQAVLALMALDALERGGASSAADRAHVLVEAIEAAFERKHELNADGAAERLLQEPLDVDPAQPAQRRGGPRGGLHTTTVAAAGADGQVVSMLVSVFDLFGCGVLVPECGFLLNDRLAGCSSDPGSPNAVAPGRRPVHTLSPALVDLGGTSFALATPGADGQVQFLAQILAAAIGEQARPRRRWRTRAGASSVTRCQAFGAACVAGVDSAEGTVFAAADLRREAAATGV